MNGIISFEKLTARLVEVFGSENLTQEYESKHEQYVMLCGWAGSMSPVSRPAYVKEFGADVVSLAEEKAREIISVKSATFKKTAFYKGAMEAANFQTKNKAPNEVGQFVFSVCSGLKGDGGRAFRDVFRDMIEYGEDRPASAFYPVSWLSVKSLMPFYNADNARLFQIRQIFNVSNEDFDLPNIAEKICEENNPNCGCCFEEEDLTLMFGREDFSNMYNIDKQEYNLFWTYGVAVVAEDGRWFLIDNEGYDYPRYIYLPINWRDMFAFTVAETEAQIKAEAEAEANRQAQEKAERLAAYNKRCEKWEKLMIDVRPLEKEMEGKEGAERDALKRKLHNVKRKNILTMARTAFPGVKFRLVRNDGWGEDWELTYFDGPTKEEMEAALDLSLFVRSYDTFDGMTDMADSETMEFYSFADKYMGFWNAGGVKLKREITDEIWENIRSQIIEIVPGAGEVENYKDYEYTEAEARKICDHFGLSMDVFGFCCGNFDLKHAIGNIVGRICSQLSFYKKPEEKSIETTNVELSGESLQLVDYSEKAFVIVGDTREAKDILKKLGGRYNARLSCGAGWVFSKRKKDAVCAALAIQ